MPARHRAVCKTTVPSERKEQHDLLASETAHKTLPKNPTEKRGLPAPTAPRGPVGNKDAEGRLRDKGAWGGAGLPAKEKMQTVEAREVAW